MRLIDSLGDDFSTIYTQHGEVCYKWCNALSTTVVDVVYSISQFVDNETLVNTRPTARPSLTLFHSVINTMLSIVVRGDSEPIPFDHKHKNYLPRHVKQLIETVAFVSRYLFDDSCLEDKKLM